MIKCHALKETDLDRRRRFADHVLTTMTEADLLNTAFSDEATFTMDGMVNSQNVRRYAKKKTKGADQDGRPANFRHQTSKNRADGVLCVHGSGTTWSSSSTRII